MSREILRDLDDGNTDGTGSWTKVARDTEHVTPDATSPVPFKQDQIPE